MKTNSFLFRALIMTSALLSALAVMQAEEDGVTSTDALARAEEETTASSGLVTLNVQNADIGQVLNAFSRQTGKSIVIGPDVTGAVTMRLSDIPWEEALGVILKPYGYGFQQVGDTIVVNKLEKIVTVESIEPVEARVFNLKYIDASDVKGIIEGQLSPRGQVGVLTVRGQKGWEFESRRMSGASRSGVSTIGKRERIEDAEDQVRSKTIVVTDIPSVLEKVDGILREVDVMPGQVLIEARFLEVNADNLVDLGVEFGTGASGAESPGVQPNAVDAGGNVYGVGAQQISGGVTPRNFPPDAAIGSTRPFNGGLSLVFQRLTEQQFEVLLHAVEEDVSANILSAPRILTLNNQEATIIVGTKFPIIEADVSGDQAVVSTSLEYYEDIGIQLNVVPQICDSDFISMIIHPAVTDQIGTQAGRTGSASDIPLTEFPVLSTREVETQIMLRSGQTIVIGGLLKDQDNTTEIKVPLLGDIPLLGRLFKRETTTRQKVDLLIFLTATMVSPEEADARQALAETDFSGTMPAREVAVAPLSPVSESVSRPDRASDEDASVTGDIDPHGVAEPVLPVDPDQADEARTAAVGIERQAENETNAAPEAVSERMPPPITSEADPEPMAEEDPASEADRAALEAARIAEAERRAKAEAERRRDEASRAEEARRAAEETFKEMERQAEVEAMQEEEARKRSAAAKIAEAERRARVDREKMANTTAEEPVEAATPAGEAR